MTASSRPRRKAAESEKTILRVATDKFTEKGFDGASIREIANQAGVTVPTIYLYFEDKRALYLAVCVSVFKRSLALILEQLHADAPPEIRIYRFLVELARELLEDPHLAKLFQRELDDADRDGLALLDREAHRISLGAVEDTIRELGEVDVVPLAALSTFALSFGLVQYTQVTPELDFPGEGSKPERLAQVVMRTVLPDTYSKLFSG